MTADNRIIISNGDIYNISLDKIGTLSILQA